MKKKKESFWIKYGEIMMIVIIVGLLFGFAFWYFGDFPYDENRQCTNKRLDWRIDNCVCEDYERICGVFEISYTEETKQCIKNNCLGSTYERFRCSDKCAEKYGYSEKNVINIVELNANNSAKPLLKN